MNNYNHEEEMEAAYQEHLAQEAAANKASGIEEREFQADLELCETYWRERGAQLQLSDEEIERSIYRDQSNLKANRR